MNFPIQASTKTKELLGQHNAVDIITFTSLLDDFIVDDELMNACNV